jgi:hypothetical protein
MDAACDSLQQIGIGGCPMKRREFIGLVGGAKDSTARNPALQLATDRFNRSAVLEGLQASAMWMESR